MKFFWWWDDPQDIALYSQPLPEAHVPTRRSACLHKPQNCSTRPEWARIGRSSTSGAYSYSAWKLWRPSFCRIILWKWDLMIYARRDPSSLMIIIRMALANSPDLFHIVYLGWGSRRSILQLLPFERFCGNTSWNGCTISSFLTCFLDKLSYYILFCRSNQNCCHNTPRFGRSYLWFCFYHWIGGRFAYLIVGSPSHTFLKSRPICLRKWISGSIINNFGGLPSRKLPIRS